ncbi:NAD(P)/FAD-dependent oxidoreductase [uncultured Phenylobacterium sp.]|uniref:flavin-containing monooxygenase n=1 Tax=uncultured Phenylobacterium sp. TaxID=349273 RepID=UPI0025EDA0FF|nr:NAD(P)/FAD-dependent oxidoreductase [uncultured Phenylobacterium sp.]
MPQAAREVTASYDAVVVGAGFSGLYMLHRLRMMGLTARVFEAGSGVGGTWYWNRYPGARVDIVSQEYSYSFSPELEDEWQWSEKYAPQEELLRYANHVADRFGLRGDVQFNTRVLSQVFDEGTGRWTVTTDAGDVVSARYCIMATGCLSVPKDIDILGADRFKGQVYRTSSWPEGLDLTGKTVAVIGTGSSAIQAIPLIAQQAKHLTVYQRTPNFSLPAHNAPADPAVAADWKANRAERRAGARAQGFGQLFIDECDKNAADFTPAERRQIMEARWAKGGFALGGSFADLVFDKSVNDEVSEFVREKIRSIVKDPALAEKLAPKNHPLFTKRPCVDSGYFDTYNRDNVALVDLTTTPIQTITEDGIRTADGERVFDVIVFAIGFDAMTGALNAVDIRGRGGQSLKEKWADGPTTYLGLMVAGFPNLFVITGPGSPSVLSNMMVSIEQHVDWISDCLAYLGERQLGLIEASPKAEADWVAHVNEVGDTTLYPLANSWYMGANVPGKPRVFMPYIGGVPVYREKCDEVAANGYDGCNLSAAGGA